MSKLQNPSNKYFVPSVAQYYSHLGLTKNMIYILPTEKYYVLEAFRDIDTSKAASTTGSLEDF